MILPKLAPAVIRCRTSGELPSLGVGPSAEYLQSCTCTCANDSVVCGQAEAKTLSEAKSGAHAAAAAKCVALGSTPTSTMTYSSSACP
jgi:hypothetical protein